MRLVHLLGLTFLAGTACHHGDDRFPLAIDLPTTAVWTIGGTTVETLEGGHDLAWVEAWIGGEQQSVIGGEGTGDGWRVRAVDRASRIVAFEYRTVDGVGVLCGGAPERPDPDALIHARCAAIRSPYAQELTLPVAPGERITWGSLALAITDGSTCTVEHDRDGVGAMLCRGLHAR